MIPTHSSARTTGIAAVLAVTVMLSACYQDRRALLPSPPPHGAGATLVRPTALSGDRTYGIRRDNPVKVGGFLDGSGAARAHAYFRSLRGPRGEEVSFFRYGRCCPFQSKNGLTGPVLLDAYGVSYAGLAAPITVYVNVYDIGAVMAPAGFTLP